MGPEIVIDNVPLWKLEYYDGHVFKNAFEINKNLIDNPISIAQIKSKEFVFLLENNQMIYVSIEEYLKSHKFYFDIDLSFEL